ncbi:ATP-dependent RNA helicase [Aeromicrobium sp.]|nr:ATP-dependent RNA helicase [Candidatus Saccharibacteria bacterium]
MDSGSLDSIYSLPINERRDEILAAVDANQVTIITAETGAGKSTQVPQYLAEHGYTKIIVTQPRILAARNLSARVRQEYSWRRGSDGTNLVGYRTAHEQDDAPENVILYCTDGLQLVRELAGNGTNERQILVLDEIHEWNENMEVLLAWAKKRCLEEPHFKIVLMSATIEANSLAKYFDAPDPITVAGRTFPVEQKYSDDLVAVVQEQISRRGNNVLVFLPGKAEIEQLATLLKADGYTLPIIPLHSQLEPEVQQRAFAHYPAGKIVLSTNIAQTSVTIDDINVVIDSGLERRAEVRNGVEGLFISEISQADCMQRAGRAGRTQAGTYILAKLDTMPCAKLEARPLYGVPEILRKHIDRLVLRLANINLDIESLEFFHAPSRNTIKQAKRTLAALGALEGQTVTAIGHRMERFPVESSYARMLVEGEQYSPAIQTKLSAIIAIQEVGGIVKGGPRFSGWRRYTQQVQSDLLAQYDVLLAVPSIAEEAYDVLGIISKNVDKALETHERLLRDLGLPEHVLQPLTTDDEEPLLKCIIAGQLHQIWAREVSGQAVNLITKQHREVSSSSVVRYAGLFVGTPFDLEVSVGSGLEVLHLVNDITIVNPTWLGQLAPQRFKIQIGKVYFDRHFGTLASRLRITAQGKDIETVGVPVVERNQTTQQLFIHLFATWAHEQLEAERLALRKHLPPVSMKRVEDQVRHLAPGAISIAELPKRERMELLKLAKLERWINKELLASLTVRNPDEPGNRHHKRHSGWKPQNKLKDRWRNR